MSFFKKYKNNKTEIKKFLEISKKIEYSNNLEDKNNIINEIDQNIIINNLLSNINEVEKNVIDKIKTSKVQVDPFFDEELIKALDNLHQFISSYIPNYPKYYDENFNVSGQAFLDARDLIKNELPVSIDEILYSNNNISGIMNDSKINFDNGYSIDSDGNIYNPNREIIFASNEPSEKIKYIDLLNKKIVTEEGIRIDLPDNFIKEFIEENDIINKNFKDALSNKTKDIENNKSLVASDILNNIYNNKYFSSNKNVTTKNDFIYATINGVPIFESEKELIELPVEDLYLGDIFENISDDNRINIIDQFKKYNIDYSNLGICNFKDIPYSELTSLLFWGGGERGVKPLASDTISNKDIVFKSDGTVLYSGANSTISTSRNGCPSKSYKTGHLCMYSDSNKLGVKRGIIQYIYSFCNMFGLFNANIPPLIGYKKFQVFPGLCIGGLIEMFLCKWQEKISSRINELFQCIPSKMISDCTQNGFENQTFQYGSSVDSLDDLDKIKSVKVGDKFVVNIVPTEITGAKENACGIFVFDPENRLKDLYLWKYKCWSGKPFVESQINSTINNSTIENMYNNPIIQDILSNTNALGEDSITRRLMDLQYAFMKKEVLLSLKDIDNSMDFLIQSAINEVLSKLTYQISQFVTMEEYHLNIYNQSDNSIYNRYEKYEYITYFYDHFKYLISNNILKSIDFDKCKRESIINTPGDGTSSIQTRLIYYDFSGYDKNEYLVPERNNVSFYDCVMFSSMFIPSEEINNSIINNNKYYEILGNKTEEYKNIKTINDYLNKSGNRSEYDNSIETSLLYTERELAYNGYENNAFEQVKKRCYYAIDNANIFGGV